MNYNHSTNRSNRSKIDSYRCNETSSPFWRRLIQRTTGHFLRKVGGTRIPESRVIGRGGLKELEGKTIKWHSMQERGRGGPTEVSGCKLLSEFMAHSAFRPNYVQDRGDLWNRRFAQLSKKTCCQSRKLNSSQNFLFYILFTLQVI